MAKLNVQFITSTPEAHIGLPAVRLDYDNLGEQVDITGSALKSSAAPTSGTVVVTANGDAHISVAPDAGPQPTATTGAYVKEGQTRHFKILKDEKVHVILPTGY